MRLFAFKLAPRDAPTLVFHRELPRSDTLLGAVSWALVDLGEDPVEVLGLEGEPKVLLSSVFPVWKDTPLFPKPAVYPALGKEPMSKEDRVKQKKLKKYAWITPEQMKRFLFGECLPTDPSEYPEDHGKVVSKKERPRVALSRFSSASQLFYSELVMVKKAWIAARLKDEGDKPKLLAALRLLGERGLGGEATYGFGAFEVEEIDFPLSEPEDASSWVSLSLYYPKPKEWPSIRASARYGVETRKGRLSRHSGNVFKPPVLYFTEGSLFPAFDFPPGKHVRLDPFPGVPHPVFIQGAPVWLAGRFSL